MQNKSIVQETSNKKIFDELLKKEIRHMNVKISHSSLTTYASSRNLLKVFLPERKFKFLLEKVSTLYYSKEIILFRKYIINIRTAWKGLNQVLISRNFQFIQIKNNDVSYTIHLLRYYDIN